MGRSSDGQHYHLCCGGVGVTDINLEIDSISGAATNFDELDTFMAFQVGAGIKLSISDNASLDIGYSFFAAHDPIYDDGVDEVEVLSGK